MNNKLIGIDELSIDYYGVGLIIKLVQIRVEKDIIKVERKLQAELNGVENINPEGFFNKVKNTYGNHKVNQLQKEINQKRAWIYNWSEKAWSTIPSGFNIRDKSIDELLEVYSSTPKLNLKRFLILQEAVLAPIYAQEKKTYGSLKEIDIEENLEHISRICYFPGSMGNAILKDTTSFLKKSSGYWKRVIKWTLIATGMALMTAGLAAPTIAAAVGGMMGLSGAAATTAGFAVFGGGSLAAGGMGMAGGMQVLVGGGALVGALSGAGVANLIGKLPQEAVAVSLAKVINYVEFLKSEKNHYIQSGREISTEVAYDGTDTISDSNPKEMSMTILSHFLESKHRSERGLMLNPTLENKSEALKNIQIMDLAYHELLKIVGIV